MGGHRPWTAARPDLRRDTKDLDEHRVSFGFLWLPPGPDGRPRSRRWPLLRSRRRTQRTPRRVDPSVRGKSTRRLPWTQRESRHEGTAVTSACVYDGDGDTRVQLGPYRRPQYSEVDVVNVNGGSGRPRSSALEMPPATFTLDGVDVRCPGEPADAPTAANAHVCVAPSSRGEATAAACPSDKQVHSPFSPAPVTS